MQLENYIDGKFIPPFHGNYLENLNPAENIVIAQIPESTAEDVELAVKSATNAQPIWSTTPLNERIDWLRTVSYTHLRAHET